MTNHATASDSPAAAELRAAWVAHDSIETEVDRRRMMGKIVDGHLNSVFVAAPPLEDNYGEGSIPAFVDFVNDAKAEGMVVLGWISNFKRTYPTPADLASSEEQDRQAEWAEELLGTFPCLDGIAIDYIRYPTWEPSNAAKNNGVSETVRRIRAVADAAGKVMLSTTFPAATVTFRGISPNQWEGDVPSWYEIWYSEHPTNYFAMEAKDGGTGIVNQENVGGTDKAFLLGPSFMSYQQDPVTWIDKGYVDHVTPMQYTADVDVMKKEVETWAALTRYIGAPMSKVNLGIGWMDEPTSFPDSAFDPSAVVSHIRNGRARGVGGFTLFRMGIPGIDDGPLIDALTKPVAANEFQPPFAVAVDSTLGSPSMDLCIVEQDDDWRDFSRPYETSGSWSSCPIGQSLLLGALLLRGLHWAFRL